MQLIWIEPQQLAVGQPPADQTELRMLRRLGLRAVLTLREHSWLALAEIKHADLLRADVLPLHVPVPREQPPTSAQAAQILRMLAACQHEQRPLLLHCTAAGDRSATVVQLYWLSRGHTLAELPLLLRRHWPHVPSISAQQRALLEHFSAQQTPA